MFSFVQSFIKKITLVGAKYNPMKVVRFFMKLIKKQKIYIHIGMPKTGSSAIQAFLALNECYLRNHGFSYPNHTGFKQAFQTSAGNVADMAKWIENKNDQAINNILNMNSTKNIILSSEILFKSLMNDPKKFKQYLQGRDYKIICYVREFTDLIESCINQQIKNHYCIDYTNVDNIATNFDYYSCLLNAETYINKKNIIVKKYGSEFFYKGNIYADFMNTLGLELDDSVIYPEKTVNPSLNRDALEFRIILNKSFFGKEDIKLKYRLNGVLGKYSVESRLDTHSKKRYLLLGPKVRECINSKYMKIEAEFVTKFFTDQRISLFKAKPYNYKKYIGLSIDKLSKILFFIKKNDMILYDEIIEFTNENLKNDDDKFKIIAALKCELIQFDEFHVQ